VKSKARNKANGGVKTLLPLDTAAYVKAQRQDKSKSFKNDMARLFGRKGLR
jgi:hypothetical protein